MGRDTSRLGVARPVVYEGEEQDLVWSTVHRWFTCILNLQPSLYRFTLRTEAMDIRSSYTSLGNRKTRSHWNRSFTHIITWSSVQQQSHLSLVLDWYSTRGTLTSDNEYLDGKIDISPFFRRWSNRIPLCIYWSTCISRIVLQTLRDPPILHN